MDTVERLRHMQKNAGDPYLQELGMRAADHVEKLQQRIAELEYEGRETVQRAYFEGWADARTQDGCALDGWPNSQARAALEGERR